MEDIVLNSNLKYVINVLNIEQRGKLLNALLGLDDVPLDEMVADIYQYIKVLQEDILKKRQRMREIGAKGNESRRKKAMLKNADEPSLFEVNKENFERFDGVESAGETHEYASRLQCDCKRKEAKENNIKNINNLFLSQKKVQFKVPSLAEVESFIAQNQLNVNAEEFINFYEGKGWFMGQTPIKRWEPVVRLWHNRSHVKSDNDDESYWSALQADESLKNESSHNAHVVFFDSQIDCAKQPQSVVDRASQLMAQTGRLNDLGEKADE